MVGYALRTRHTGTQPQPQDDTHHGVTGNSDAMPNADIAVMDTKQSRRMTRAVATTGPNGDVDATSIAIPHEEGDDDHGSREHRHQKRRQVPIFWKKSNNEHFLYESENDDDEHGEEDATKKKRSSSSSLSTKYTTPHLTNKAELDAYLNALNNSTRLVGRKNFVRQYAYVMNRREKAVVLRDAMKNKKNGSASTANASTASFSFNRDEKVAFAAKDRYSEFPPNPSAELVFVAMSPEEIRHHRAAQDGGEGGDDPSSTTSPPAETSSFAIKCTLCDTVFASKMKPPRDVDTYRWDVDRHCRTHVHLAHIALTEDEERTAKQIESIMFPAKHAKKNVVSQEEQPVGKKNNKSRTRQGTGKTEVRNKKGQTTVAESVGPQRQIVDQAEDPKMTDEELQALIAGLEEDLATARREEDFYNHVEAEEEEEGEANVASRQQQTNGSASKPKRKKGTQSAVSSSPSSTMQVPPQRLAARRILDRRLNPITAQLEYLVEWRGYGAQHATFEPYTGATFGAEAEPLVLEFEARRAKMEHQGLNDAHFQHNNNSPAAEDDDDDDKKKEEKAPPLLRQREEAPPSSLAATPRHLQHSAIVVSTSPRPLLLAKPFVVPIDSTIAPRQQQLRPPPPPSLSNVAHQDDLHDDVPDGLPTKQPRREQYTTKKQQDRFLLVPTSHNVPTSYWEDGNSQTVAVDNEMEEDDDAKEEEEEDGRYLMSDLLFVEKQGGEHNGLLPPSSSSLCGQYIAVGDVLSATCGGDADGGDSDDEQEESTLPPSSFLFGASRKVGVDSVGNTGGGNGNGFGGGGGGTNGNGNAPGADPASPLLREGPVRCLSQAEFADRWFDRGAVPHYNFLTSARSCAPIIVSGGGSPPASATQEVEVDSLLPRHLVPSANFLKKHRQQQDPSAVRGAENKTGNRNTSKKEPKKSAKASGSSPHSAEEEKVKEQQVEGSRFMFSTTCVRFGPYVTVQEIELPLPTEACRGGVNTSNDNDTLGGETTNASIIAVIVEKHEVPLPVEDHAITPLPLFLCDKEQVLRTSTLATPEAFALEWDGDSQLNHLMWLSKQQQEVTTEEATNKQHRQQMMDGDDDHQPAGGQQQHKNEDEEQRVFTATSRSTTKYQHDDLLHYALDGVGLDGQLDDDPEDLFVRFTDSCAVTDVLRSVAQQQRRRAEQQGGEEPPQNGNGKRGINNPEREELAKEKSSDSHQNTLVWFFCPLSTFRLLYPQQLIGYLLGHSLLME